MKTETYTIWTDYGSEGWKPTDFTSKEELVKHLLKGGIYGTIRITKIIDLKVDAS